MVEFVNQQFVPANSLYTAAQVRELDRRVIEDYAVPGFTLMGRAAAAAFASLRWRWPHARRITVVCGPGNNGGDGFLIGRLALQANLHVDLYFLGQREKSSGDALLALQAFEETGEVVLPFNGELKPNSDVIVDALLGTGLGRNVEGEFSNAVSAINTAAECGAGIIAIDIASGLDADTGKIWGVGVRAQVTATFIGKKLGIYTGTGPAVSGTVEFYPLDSPVDAYAGLTPAAQRITGEDVRAALPARPRDAHKGGNGHVLCVGGNHGMGGAVRMAAEAALRVGAGLVSVATRESHAAALTQARPELMCRGVASATEIDALLNQADVVAVGPGLGQDAWARSLFARILETRHPLVVDADALNLLAAEPVERENWILTPHPGEAARLLGCNTADVQKARPAAIAELVARFNAIVVLKGAGSLVQAPGGPLWLCDAGNPGMAVGGMGDVLTGVIAGLLAQGVNARCADIADSVDRAARAGVYMHACAGDAAAQSGGQRGLLPTDLFAHLRRAANPV